MSKRPYLILCASVLFTQSALAPAQPTVEKLYGDHCSQCHGADLEGGKASALNDGQWKISGDDKAIAEAITNPKWHKKLPKGKNALTAEDVRALVVYIHERTYQAHLPELEASVAPQDGVYSTGGHKFTLDKVAEAPGELWSMAFLPNGDMLATQRSGTLWRFSEGERVAEIAGIPTVWNHGQGGLLEVRLHPDYSRNQWIYLTFSEASEQGGMTKVVRGKIQDDQWREQQTIYTSPEKFHNSSGAHFGSRLAFQDGYLYFTVGDRGIPPEAQDVSRPNGKVHRLHDDGKVPENNPLAAQENAYPSIWSLGNRNPQGLAVHPVTGDLWSSEHGPRGGDELNLIEPGLNYGWPVISHGINYNGTPVTAKIAAPDMEQPKHEWTPSTAVSQIAFYTGDQFPKWRNQLLVGSLRMEELRLVEIDGQTVRKDTLLLRGNGRIRDIVTGPDGYPYVIFNGRRGEIHKLVPHKDKE